MPAAESKPMHVMVTPLIHCPEEPPAPLATLEEELAPVPTIKVPDMLRESPASVEPPASVPEQHHERCQKTTIATTVGPAEASGPGVIEPVMAAGAEYLPAAESEPMHVVVTPLIHCPDLEEPLAPLATLEDEHAPAPITEVPDMPKQPPASVEQPALAPEQHHESRQEPSPATTMGTGEHSGPEVIEPVMAAGAECLARAEMPAAESKPMHLAARTLIHCPDVEEPPAPLAAPR
ncbi:uncharacterized protein LOC144284649 [Canis aureus]